MPERQRLIPPEVAGTAFLMGLTGTPGPPPDSLTVVQSPFGTVEVFSQNTRAAFPPLRVAFRKHGHEGIWYVRAAAPQWETHGADWATVREALDRFDWERFQVEDVPGWEKWGYLARST